MKKFYLVLPLVGLMATAAWAATPSTLTSGGGVNTAQYHSYDGLVCTDCHALHNSEDGSTVDYAGSGAEGNPALLFRANVTDVCLGCHMAGQNTSATSVAGPNVVDSGWEAPIVMTTDGVVPSGKAMPAGDFYWSDNDPTKGHNPAFEKGQTEPSVFMTADATLGITPPGGTALAGEWTCHSCHGMHSRFSSSYTAWRQVQRKINGIVVTGDVTGFGVETAAGNKTQNPAYEPILSNSRGDIVGTSYVNVRPDGNPLEGADLYADESDTNKNIYRGGFSSFCSACHGDFHGGNNETEGVDNGNTHVGGAWVRHPTNVVMADKNTGGLSTRKYGVSTYTHQVLNAQGTQPNPVGYDYRYPLVQPNTDFTVTSTGASMASSTSVLPDDRIMCLTCHKAHASRYANMTRWDANSHSFVADGAPGINGVASDGDNPAFGCGKCHQKGGTNAFVKAF